jgi:hypothetical protein
MVLRTRKSFLEGGVYSEEHYKSQLTLDLLDDMLRVSDGLYLSKWIGFTSRTSPKRRWLENELDEASIGETKQARSCFISIEVRDGEG